MSTVTRTHTRTDVRVAFEMFAADLQMLALRTQAMTLEFAKDCAGDICLMAQAECLTHVHIQLRDSSDRLVRVHRYTVEQGVLSKSQRPGENRWPCLPSGTLIVVVKYSNNIKMEQLKNSGNLKLIWGASSLSTDYSGMKNQGNRLYSSSGYGLRRDTFTS